MFDMTQAADLRVVSLSLYLSTLERDRDASLSQATMARQDREARAARRVYQAERAKRNGTAVRRRVIAS